MPGSVLEVFWKDFKSVLRGHGGIYVLYRHGIPHYVGRAAALHWRIKDHTRDRLKRKWDTFSLYVVRGDRHIKDLETLLLRIVEPPGAWVSGHFKGAKNLKKDLYRELERYADALMELKPR